MAPDRYLRLQSDHATGGYQVPTLGSPPAGPQLPQPAAEDDEVRPAQVPSSSSGGRGYSAQDHSDLPQSLLP